MRGRSGFTLRFNFGPTRLVEAEVVVWMECARLCLVNLPQVSLLALVADAVVVLDEHCPSSGPLAPVPPPVWEVSTEEEVLNTE